MPSSDHDSITQQPFGPMPEPSMHRTLSRSDSLLPQSESPNVAPINDYDRSLYKFPWLGSESCRNLEDEENLKGRDDPGCRQPTTSDLGICRDCDSEPSQAISPDGQDEAMTAKHRPGAGDYGNEDAEKEDPNLVTWSSSDDPANPKNWPRRQKWTATILVSCFTFISPVSSTMLAPALPILEEEFRTSSKTETYFLMSIFLLAYAVGPFVLAPLSEMYGRVSVLQIANLVFLLFNTIGGWSVNKEMMLAMRFLSGLGGSAPQALGGGVLSDCWRAEERGTAHAVYSLPPFLGPAVGPIAAGYLTQHLNWRWIFWTVSIADALVQVLAFLFLRETYAPKILLLKARWLRKETGNAELHTEWERPDRTFAQTLGKNLVRPFRMLFTQPTLQVTALYRAYLYGLMYLVLASFPMVWMQQYNQQPGPASLNYISLGVGFVIGLQISGPAIDKTYRHLQQKYAHAGLPEFRVPLMLPTAVIVPAGLVLYGVAAHFRLHWTVPNVGAAIFAGGLILSFQCVQTYTVDTYERYAASATGAAAFVRTMAGFSFPLFAPRLYEELGIAVGNGVLAGIALVLGIIVPLGMWRWGAWLRSKSTYCMG